MSSIGEFESLFKRALREKYEFTQIGIDKVLTITDMDPTRASVFGVQVENFLESCLGVKPKFVETMDGSKFDNWSDLQKRLDQLNPDLIVSYRLLRVNDLRIETSLGVYIDTISQQTDFPVLVMPHPDLEDVDAAEVHSGNTVVATEHIYKDNELLDFAIAFTPAKGNLHLVHVEDEDTFNYYIRAIEKIPAIDTEAAREGLLEQLESAPRHYLESAKELIAEIRDDLSVNITTGIGHLINAYKELISETKADLLVFQTKDDTQMAMHSLGYSLAVEFNKIPVLLV